MSRKTASIFLLFSFAMLSVSAVCLASTNMSMMDNCGDAGHDVGAAMCPFMSSSIPAMTAGALLVVVVALVLGVKLTDDKEFDLRKSREYELASSESPGSFKDPVLGLISRGILHSRVYAF